MESVTYRNLNLNVWDLGGQTSIRPYWRCYYANTAAVIFVVDSTDIDRLQIAADELAAMLAEEELRDAALLVFANKQDQPGAKGAGEISEALKLGELRDRNWTIIACSAIDGRGINEGMDWLVVSDILLSSRLSATSNSMAANGGRRHIITASYREMPIQVFALDIKGHCPNSVYRARPRPRPSSSDFPWFEQLVLAKIAKEKPVL